VIGPWANSALAVGELAAAAWVAVAVGCRRGVGGSGQNAMTKASSVRANAVVALVLEVGDRTDVWGPHGSEMSYGTQLSEKEREEHIRGREDISSEPADWTPACGAGVACHISKYGKNITQTSLH